MVIISTKCRFVQHCRTGDYCYCDCC